jgi:serine protease AprX
MGYAGVTGACQNVRMRLFSKYLLSCLFLALSLSLVVALSLPGTGVAGNKDKKLDKHLAALAAAAAPNSELQVLVTGPGASAAVAAQGGKKTTDFSLVNAVAARVRAKDVSALADSAGVTFLAADSVLQPTSGPDPTKLLTLYPKIDGAPAAWTAKWDGTNVGIALIDSGVHRFGDVDNTVQIKAPGIDTIDPDDKYGHGTLVTGIIVGQKGDSTYVGVAPGAKLYSLNVQRPDGVHSSDVIKALEWVFNNAHKYNIRVVNLSLAERQSSSYQTNLLDLAVERVWAAGIAVVVSAGNGGPGMVDFAPANDPLVITVGATDSNDTLATADDQVASWSASGTTVDNFDKPDVLAPGRRIVTTLNKETTLWQQAPRPNQIRDNYAMISGTSFAAPQVAGALADLFEQHPDWSPDNVKWLLAQTAKSVQGSQAGALALDAATAFSGTPSRANQGVPALVCAPSTSCITGGVVGTVSSSWNSSSWNSSSWNSSSWNSSSWNSSSWNSSGWNSSSWNSSTWNDASWNSYGWD